MISNVFSAAHPLLLADVRLTCQAHTPIVLWEIAVPSEKQFGGKADGNVFDAEVC